MSDNLLSPNSSVPAASPQVVRYQKLILERLDNEPLLAAFGVDTGFNMQERIWGRSHYL